MNKKIGSLEGTPWHIETIRMNENDSRRHKKWCKYFKNGFCSYNLSNCYSSKECNFYVYDSAKQPKKNSYRYSKNSIKNNNKTNLKGKFTLKFADGIVETFCIGENINQNAPILEKIITCKIGKEFDYNNEKIIILSKKIRKISNIQKNLLKSILINKPIDKKEGKIKNIDKLYFKIKFTNLNLIVFFKTGKNIRWDDPLINKILKTSNGKTFIYKNYKILLINKYIRKI